MAKRKIILIVGIPRSGTTWIAKILSKSTGAYYLHEPDNEKNNILAYIFKKGLHRYPYLNANDHLDSYYKLWEIAFKGKVIPKMINRFLRVLAIPRSKRLPIYENKVSSCLTDEFNTITKFFEKYQLYLTKYFTWKIIPYPEILIIKSVHCILSLPWIEKNFRPSKIIVVFKNPFNVITNYLEMKLPDAIRNIFNQNGLIEDHFKFLKSSHLDIINHGTFIQKMAMQIGGFYYFLEKEIPKHNDWIKIYHEDLCVNPIKKFYELFNKLNLKWNKNVENFIKKHDKKGKGFSISRKANEEIDKWKHNLSEPQIKEILECLKIFNQSTKWNKKWMNQFL
ncbi:sulfotransferase domain protein [Candidatus Desulfofervidus auxilii]|uniref:Sulfotransferase domain protein n=1 Tax=Desulfofervidus auxilii TaxID=1621989 RepID=A0A7U4TH31_DESA2|nr:sulfotransferase [Candidatus Desulfofervidus auxilii]AMM41429.1 sulfotransferase domain protein [Candidatus Desulfofervidus auxilii]CAD7778176.1 hypothetical protein BLFGPEAP_01898 [Candidatus Methanoperedenaceae archaeon GB50]